MRPLKITSTISLIYLISYIYSVTAHAQDRHFSNEFSTCTKDAKGINDQSECVTKEISFQKKRLNENYSKVAKTLAPEDREYMDKIQRDWIRWRDGNYNFLAEHVAGEFTTTRVTSLNFLLNAIYDRANEMKMILDQTGKK
ncbi:lysozyme inhibitor LprI family protein [Cupriavidus sp. M-11]|uniref:lysozyme inhibitor LprI family protein n=1 Tax=Cupriavidus sp. M-11 TaxID=3233038 RepID=UPI003F8F1832